jgi:hypothetical protein
MLLLLLALRLRLPAMAMAMAARARVRAPFAHPFIHSCTQDENEPRSDERGKSSLVDGRARCKSSLLPQNHLQPHKTTRPLTNPQDHKATYKPARPQGQQKETTATAAFTDINASSSIPVPPPTFIVH